MAHPDFFTFSYTILSNTGTSTTDLGGWRSTNMPEGYIEESVENKIKMTKKNV